MKRAERLFLENFIDLLEKVCKADNPETTEEGRMIAHKNQLQTAKYIYRKLGGNV